MARYLYSELSSLITARKNGQFNTNCDAGREWFERHNKTIDSLCQQHLPSGSGFDMGSRLDFELSHAEKLVFTTSFHHMDDGGYTGWTDHTITVTPSFQGINIRISGRNRNDIKEAIHQAFDSALKTDVTYDLYLPHYPQFAITSKWEEKDGSPSQCYQAWFVTVDGKEHRFWNDYQSARSFAASFLNPSSLRHYSLKGEL